MLLADINNSVAHENVMNEAHLPAAVQFVVTRIASGRSRRFLNVCKPSPIAPLACESALALTLGRLAPVPSGSGTSSNAAPSGPPLPGVRHLGIEVDDAIEFIEKIDI